MHLNQKNNVIGRKNQNLELFLQHNFEFNLKKKNKSGQLGSITVVDLISSLD